ncbi:family 16 glycosylhydrolase [Algibacter mikhailovii]|uniref:GH16 domain-containing protein n=1 Tax=Algibacter mikhailovii TaxID=425498 RepID=A0A918VBG3_9FLAO|nr:family 16 glycosylhydrolase [Algibacter mikhailovii]GGZ86016.1 hypothetical protein GCM10007028_25400 [Algibacter mikhailovii]
MNTKFKLLLLSISLTFLLFPSCEKQDEFDLVEKYLEAAPQSDLNVVAGTNASSKAGFTLVWEDQFGSFDSSKWRKNYIYDYGVSNAHEAPVGGSFNISAHEGAAYKTGQISYINDATASDGKSMRFKLENKPTVSLRGHTLPYASGCVMGKSTDQGKLKYGLIEAKIKMPGNAGTWPAFWLMPESDNIYRPYGAEIDAMEHFPSIYSTKNKINYGLFWDGYGGTDISPQSWKANSSGVDIGTTPNVWKVFTLEWNPDEIILYVDGVQKARYTGEAVPIAEHYIILNLAAGGTNFAGAINPSELPLNMDIDYVKYYQYSNYAAIQAMEDAKHGSRATNRYDFEDITIDKIHDLAAKKFNKDYVRISTQKAATSANNTGIANATPTTKIEVINGDKSLFIDSRGKSGDWFEAFSTPTGMFKSGVNYTVTINYKAAERVSGAYAYAIVQSEAVGASPKQIASYSIHGSGTNQDNQGRLEFSFTPSRNDYNLLLGLYKNCAYIIDDIIIQGETGAETGQEGSTTPPPSTGGTISITSPSVGATITSTSLTVNAKSTGDVTFAEIKVDGVYKGHKNMSPYSFDLTGLTAGAHEIKVYTNSTSQGWINDVININVNTGGGTPPFIQDFNSNTKFEINSAGANQISSTVYPRVILATKAVDLIDNSTAWRVNTMNLPTNAFHEFYFSPEKKMEANKTYKIEFDYKVLKTAGDAAYVYVISKSKTQGGSNKGWNQKTLLTGQTGSISTTISTGSISDYYAIIGVHNRGKVSIDNVKITQQ